MAKRIERFVGNESGAALIEYTVLIGLIAGAAIIVILAVGALVTNRWALLQTSLGLTT